jgi:hypothetical protein
MNPALVLNRMDAFETEGASTALPVLEAFFDRLEDTYNERLYLQPKDRLLFTLEFLCKYRQRCARSSEMFLERKRGELWAMLTPPV